MEEFVNAKPRYVIESLAIRPFVTGEDTSDAFPEFYTYLEKHYAKVVLDNKYVIWEIQKQGQP
jgi:hypothetical protein